MNTRLVALVMLFAVAFAACSGEIESDEVATLDTSTAESMPSDESDVTSEAEAEEAMLAFSECLRDEGIDIEDPTIGVDGSLGLTFGGPDTEMDFEAFEAAQQVCSVHLEGVSLGFDNFDQTEFQDQLLEFAVCMRENGVEMDDPDFSSFAPDSDGDGEVQVVEPFSAFNADDPAFEEAFEVCGGFLSGPVGNQS